MVLEKRSSRLLNLTELQQKLGRPRGWIYRLIHARQIPFVPMGRSYFFVEAEIDRWLEAATVQPTAAPATPARADRSLDDELAAFGIDREDFEAVN